jgi:endonuclease-3 related protein
VPERLRAALSEEARPDSGEAPFRSLFERLLEAYGAQGWWPADTAFEVMVGAILTQNTAWSNVERALAGLRGETELTPHGLMRLDEDALAKAIRPSGYFNVKARRLRAFCSELLAAGGLEALSEQPTGQLRDWLLRINGVGPETADDILLYAFERPVFVVDAYTRRLFARLQLIAGTESYEELRRMVEAEIGPDAACFSELHALVVRHAKEICRARSPRCPACPLRRDCPSRDGA